MNRSERRRLKREEEKADLNKKLDRLVNVLLNQFYITMRENKISKDRANKILQETAERINK